MRVGNLNQNHFRKKTDDIDNIIVVKRRKAERKLEKLINRLRDHYYCGLHFKVTFYPYRGRIYCITACKFNYNNTR